MMVIMVLAAACVSRNDALDDELLSADQAILPRDAGTNNALDDKLLSAAGTGDSALIENLLDRGADIEARDDDGETALMKASAAGQAAVVETLLDRGAALEAREDVIGFTALMGASRYGQAAVVETLLNRGADISARSDEGETALDIAYIKEQQEVIKVLRAAGAAR